MNKVSKILPFYISVLDRLEVRSKLVADDFREGRSEAQVPHPKLYGVLVSDPSMAAILSAGSDRFALSSLGQAPFSISASGLIMLPPALLEDPPALAACARWGMECSHARANGAVNHRQLLGLAFYGVQLVSMLSLSSRQSLFSMIPSSIVAEFTDSECFKPSFAFIAWLSSLMGVACVKDNASWLMPISELSSPVEKILVHGGDSRLVPDAFSGYNRYGVPPRPRPEAVHFSSSTASAISEHGFLLVDLLRKKLLMELSAKGVSEPALRKRVVEAVAYEILNLLKLDQSSADLVITPSGTDAELLAVVVARAGSNGKPITNVLVSPEESGRGVKLAAAGKYFDSIAANGRAIVSGEAVWPEAGIHVQAISIRDETGQLLPSDVVNERFKHECEKALASGHHVVAHVLFPSKTDICAPSIETVRKVVANAHGNIDIVVDACQMRTNFLQLGEFVRDGWMVEISGSKFLTGPPFSGALILPSKMRSRGQGILQDLLQHPEVGDVGNWFSPWAVEGKDANLPSYGPLFRWLPALLEASMLSSLSETMRREAFHRFRDAILQRLTKSTYLRLLNMTEAEVPADPLTRPFIFSFEVFGLQSNGEISALAESDCALLFRILNEDATHLLPFTGFENCSIARQQVHIGQPVTLGSGETAITVLRFVLGARFFNIVGYAGENSYEAALESEISDAIRAIAKVELLASSWSSILKNYEN